MIKGQGAGPARGAPALYQWQDGLRRQESYRGQVGRPARRLCHQPTTLGHSPHGAGQEHPWGGGPVAGRSYTQATPTPGGTPREGQLLSSRVVGGAERRPISQADRLPGPLQLQREGSQRKETASKPCEERRRALGMFPLEKRSLGGGDRTGGSPEVPERGSEEGSRWEGLQSWV